MHIRKLIAMVACAASLGAGAQAGSDLETALGNGATQLSADEIADLVVGKVVTAKSGGKTFRFYYDPSNRIDGELQGGGWSGSGAYAITDSDQVCVSMAKDAGRYRCLTVVKNGDVVRKYTARGKLAWELTGFETAGGL